MHAAAEVTPLRDGAGDGQLDQGRVMDAALVQAPVCRRLDGMRPELEHASGNEAQEHHGEEGDVVDTVLGLHSRDQGGTP